MRTVAIGLMELVCRHLARPSSAARSFVSILCVLFFVPRAMAQNSSEKPEASYALDAGKVEASAVTGLYLIEYGQDYQLGSRVLVGGDVAVGLASHWAVEGGASFAGYRNDMYWKPDPPHNPYLATGRALSLFGGGRYEFRNPAGRVRPYLGGGIVAARFVSVERGPKALCFDDGACIVMAPELFEGTKVTGFFDMGINFMFRPAWGLRTGVRSYPLKGDESFPVRSLTGPSSNNSFWHTQLYVGVLRRWR